MKSRIKIIVVILLLVSCRNEDPRHEKHPPSDASYITLTPHEQKLANISTVTVEKKSVMPEITLYGMVVVDEDNVSFITSRIKGRIEKLHAKNPGDKIKKGQLLYEIYSEELLADENDFLLSLNHLEKFPGQKSTLQPLADASRKKLLLWGMNEKQIAELANKKIAAPLMSFYSDAEGVLQELYIREGEYAETGTPLFKISDTREIWVEAQIYPDEIYLLEGNPSFEIEFDLFPDEIFSGKIVSLIPSLQDNSKINIIRIRVSNKKLKIIPGMMAYVKLKTKIIEGLVVPKEAIIKGKMDMLWIETEPGKYEPRIVHVISETKTLAIIHHGIKEGDKVVVNGSWLLNSEFTIRHGSNPMEGHQH